MLKVQRLGLAALERSIWRHRSRINWIREGDASTRFFHSKASLRRRKNYIHHVMVGDVAYTEQADKLHTMTDYFEGLLGANSARDQHFNLQAIGIEEHNLQELDLLITEEEDVP